MAEHRKCLPPGIWFRIYVAKQTTEQQIADAFCRVGIHVTTEAIAIAEDPPEGHKAIVALSLDTVCALVQAQISPMSINGKQIQVRTMPSKKGPPPPPPPNVPIKKGA